MTHLKTQSLLLLSLLVVGWGLSGNPAVAQHAGGSSAPVQAKAQPLSYWLSQAAQTERSESLDRIVEALSQAVRSEDYSAKVAAADALSALGPAALGAMPALIDQLDHVQPWVREGAAGAIASFGKAGVPAMIDVFQKNASLRIRIAFLWGSMGPDAREAVSVLIEAMEQESPVNRARLAGILNQIDPAKYAGETGRHASSDRVNLSSGSESDAAPVTADWPQFHGPVAIRSAASGGS